MTSLPLESRAAQRPESELNRASSDPLPTDSPEAAVGRALAQRQLAFATELCAQHYGPCLGRLCMAMLGNQADAEELAQETLLSAHRAWSTYRSDGSVKAWLLGIARKKCLKHRSQRSRRTELLQIAPAPTAVRATDELLIRQQQGAAARSALEQIRPTEREAVLLRYVGELSFADVAFASDVEVATARKRVSRALCKLRTLLSPTESV